VRGKKAVYAAITKLERFQDGSKGEKKLGMWKKGGLAVGFKKRLLKKGNTPAKREKWGQGRDHGIKRAKVGAGQEEKTKAITSEPAELQNPDHSSQGPP